MAYDFEQTLSRIVRLREEAKKGNYRPVLRALTTFLEEAADKNLPVQAINGLIHRAILRMHQYERSENSIYLAYYFSDIKAATELASVVFISHEVRRQLYRRMGDYFYEVGDHEDSKRFYQLAAIDPPAGIEYAEYAAPLGRALVLAGSPRTAAGFALLAKSLKASKTRNRMPVWHQQIIKAGVLMKYAEAQMHAGRKQQAIKLMDQAKKIAVNLDRQHFHQRLIQWHRLARKLGIEKR